MHILALYPLGLCLQQSICLPACLCPAARLGSCWLLLAQPPWVCMLRFCVGPTRQCRKRACPTQHVPSSWWLLQVPLLRYRLPAMACTPPVLASLISQSSSKGVLLTCHILVSPSMPGSLEAVALSMLLPAVSKAPVKVC